VGAGERRRLAAIPGVVPALINPPEGCRFAPRCAHAKAQCTAATPALRAVGERHRAACVLA